MREHWFSLFLEKGRVKAVPEPKRNNLALSKKNFAIFARFFFYVYEEYYNNTPIL